MTKISRILATFLLLAKSKISPRTIALASAFLSIIYGTYVRLFNLSAPPKIVFDEAHYVKCARAFLDNNYFFNDHPAFGKLLIGIGMMMFGDESFGWRIMPALFGIFVPILGAVLCHMLYRSIAGACICCIFLSLDGFLIAYTRTAHLDGMMLCFALIGLILAANREQRWYFYPLISGCWMGLSGAMKLNGLWPLLPAAFLYIHNHKPKYISLLISGAVLSYFTTAVLAHKIMNTFDPVSAAFDWQSRSLHFHTSSLSTHIFSSPWYSWLVMLRPVLIHYDYTSDPVGVISTFPNPLLLWSTSLFLVCILFCLLQYSLSLKPLLKPFTYPHSVISIAYAANLAPWLLISRPAFFYHYLPSYVLLVIGLSGVLPFWLNKNRLLVGAYILVIISSGVFFLPLSTGELMSRADLSRRQWVSCWFEGC